MIIILNKADFSSNNIGKINIPVNLTTRQKKILSKYSKALSYNQKMAFGSFMNNLDSAGIINKLKALFLPVLAGNISEAFINIVTEDLSKDIDLSSSQYFKLENGGIFNTATTSSVAESLYFQSIKDLSLRDFSVIAKIKSEDTGSETTGLMYFYESNPEAIIQVGKNDSQHKAYFMSMKFNSGAIDYATAVGDNPYNHTVGFNDGVYGYSLKDNKVMLIGDTILSKDILEEYASQFPYGVVNSSSKFNGPSRNCFKNPHYAIGIGYGLTEEECSTFKSEINAFVQTILQN